MRDVSRESSMRASCSAATAAAATISTGSAMRAIARALSVPFAGRRTGPASARVGTA
jgi:hypothetical protein